MLLLIAHLCTHHMPSTVQLLLYSYLYAASLFAHELTLHGRPLEP